jgi:hypothetical protein
MFGWLRKKKKNFDSFRIVNEQVINTDPYTMRRALIKIVHEDGFYKFWLKDKVENNYNDIDLGIGKYQAAKELGLKEYSDEYFKFLSEYNTKCIVVVKSDKLTKFETVHEQYQKSLGLVDDTIPIQYRQIPSPVMVVEIGENRTLTLNSSKVISIKIEKIEDIKTVTLTHNYSRSKK